MSCPGCSFRGCSSGSLRRHILDKHHEIVPHIGNDLKEWCKKCYDEGTPSLYVLCKLLYSLIL